MATGPMTTTTHGVFIPELWSKMILFARLSAAIVAKRIQRIEAEVKFGDTLRIPNVTKIAAGDVTAGTGAFTFTTNTESDTVLSINKWRHAAIEILDNLSAQSSNYGLASIYTPWLGKQLEVDLEALIFDRMDGTDAGDEFSVTKGTAGAGWGDALVLSAIQALDEADVPQAGRSLFVHPSDVTAMRKLDKFSLYLGTGANKPAVVSGKFDESSAPLVEEYYVGQVYNIPVWYHNQLNVNNNILLHKDSWVVGHQRNIKVESTRETSAGKLADIVVAHHMFGFKELRNDHGVIVKS